jgi:ribulose kinase
MPTVSQTNKSQKRTKCLPLKYIQAMESALATCVDSIFISKVSIVSICCAFDISILLLLGRIVTLITDQGSEFWSFSFVPGGTN